MRECDPCAQDHDGYTPVHYAIERDDVEMLKALTTRFCSDIKLFSNEQINIIHNNCLKAISIRQKQGLTGFMLACYQQSIKCLNYLVELQINDVDLQVYV
jgi:ankyrin repeat protein